MSPWLIAAAVLLAAMPAPLWVAVRRPLVDALVALELAGALSTVVLLLAAEGTHRSALMDPAVVLGVMTFIGGLAYARMLEGRV